METSPPSFEKRSAFVGGSAVDWTATKTCVHPIRATACYGDCMSDAKSCTSKGGFVETLMSPSYEGTEALSICGDSLYASLQSAKTSPALRVDLPDCARF